MTISRCRYAAKILAIVFLSSISLFAQSDLDKGKASFNEGNYEEAIELLKGDIQNPSSLHYLGLSYEKLGKLQMALLKYKDSVLQCEKLVLKLVQEKNEFGTYGQRIKHLMDSYGDNFRDAEKSLAKYKQMRSRKKLEKKLRNSLPLIRIFPEIAEGLKDTSKPKSVSPITILSKPRATYTILARQNKFSGSIQVRVAFLKNGKIGFAIPINKLPYGLTEAVIDAVKKIKFKPAKRNGKPTTVIKRIQYSYTVF